MSKCKVHYIILLCKTEWFITITFFQYGQKRDTLTICENRLRSNAKRAEDHNLA